MILACSRGFAIVLFVIGNGTAQSLTKFFLFTTLQLFMAVFIWSSPRILTSWTVFKRSYRLSDLSSEARIEYFSRIYSASTSFC